MNRTTLCSDGTTPLQNAIVLQDTQAVVEGLTIYGSSWQPQFHNTSFYVPRDQVLSLGQAPDGRQRAAAAGSRGPLLGVYCSVLRHTMAAKLALTCQLVHQCEDCRRCR